ncbi:TPA: hypothetical protein ACQ31I_004228 [Yersinia enterocolitica]
MTDRLLPVGSSVLEVAAARACAGLENTPAPFALMSVCWKLVLPRKCIPN